MPDDHPGSGAEDQIPPPALPHDIGCSVSSEGNSHAFGAGLGAHGVLECFDGGFDQAQDLDLGKVGKTLVPADLLHWNQ